jgi:hypothetical protein
VADPSTISGPATPAAAASVVALIQEAGALATDHFAQLPEGEEATVYVLLTAATGYGVITLGVWSFLRDAQGGVSLYGAQPEAVDG